MQLRQINSGQVRYGLTLVESLVAIAIVCVLIGLTTMAVQFARETSRRISCQNNLKQIGLALQAYDATHHCFPGLTDRRSSASPFFWLLPHLESQNEFDAMLRDYPLHYPSSSSAPAWKESPISSYMCPSDADAFSGTNYRLNVGTGLYSFSEMHRPRPPKNAKRGDGFFEEKKLLRFADITDGLSNTLAISERCRSDGSRANFAADFLSLNFDPDVNVGPLQYLSRCAAASAADYPISAISGRSWFISGQPFTYYNHIATPSQIGHDCLHSLELSPPSRNGGIIRSTSNHANVVNCALGDGSVRTITYAINPAAWRAMGTRASGDLNSFE